jgi:uncharacterized protein (TIGR00369 family)
MPEPIPSHGVTRDQLAELIRHSPFAAYLGARVIECRDGVAELDVPIRPELTQLHGFVHGAIVGFAADTACAWAAASLMGNVVTGEYKIHFLQPAQGERLIGRGTVLKASRRMVTCRADVFAVQDGREQLVATALATVIPIGG